MFRHAPKSRKETKTMKWTGLNELREMYLSFFESKGHLRLKSFPLVPQGDKIFAADQFRHGADEKILYG